MTTKKQPPISKHKHTATRRPVQASPQAFDIIPRSQVRPSTTSRPVIPTSGPEVPDTTLTKPTAPGVSVADLIAKRSGPAAVAAPTVDEQPKLPPVDTPPIADAATATTADVSAAAPEVAVPGPAPQPDNEPVIIESEPAAVQVPATDTDTSAVAADQTQPAAPTAPEPAAPTEAEAEADTNDSDPLAHVLRDDSVQTGSQEHSDSLKSAIKDLGDKADVPHYELYGGKPVIVVHKAHGHRSALAWSLWFFFCVGLALLVVNLLLDAGVIETTYDIPFTDFL